ncbi:MAG: rimM, partial [Acidimicrobiia bacterium]|nr:rimM [Acidimicrobiia bacterium]
DGIGTRDAAEEIRGSVVSVDERRPLGDDEFWPEDLMGLSVFDESGELVGVVEGVVFGPGQDRLVIAIEAGTRFEIPFVDELVPVVDIDARRVEIKSIPGLIEPG